ncbi:MAG: hypothetical protein R2771_12180 [Saprospiraceae bacterium]
MTFYQDKLRVNLNLKNKKVNRFDFLLGLQQDKTTLNKYKITGEGLLDLINKLGKGERIFLNYKSLTSSKQELTIKSNYPYIFDMPFGFDGNMNIYLNEDEYRDVDFKLALQYFIKSKTELKLFWSNNSSRLITLDTTELLSAKTLPDKLDVTSNNIGFALSSSNLDYFYNPSKGLSISLEGYIGERNIRKNQSLTSISNENVDFSNAYDTLRLKTLTFGSLADISFYWSIGSSIVLKLENRTGYKYSEGKIYQNELYKLGGNSILRGFNEQSILAKFYNVFTLEPRMIFGKNSFIFAFFDYGLINDPYATNSWDSPYSIGAGINFDTKNGMLQLSVGIGSQYKQALNYKESTVHIGYVSLFE